MTAARGRRQTRVTKLSRDTEGALHPQEAAMTMTSIAPDLSHRLLTVRELTERLAARLSPEDQTAQSMTEASPTKWHRAHTSWFFEEFVLGPAGGYALFDPTYRYLF